MKKIILLVLSVILLISSLCIVIDRVLVPFLKEKSTEKELDRINKEVNEYIASASESKEEEEQTAPIRLEATDANIAKVYIGKYISYINNKDFDSAYNMLTTNFKKINFKTQEDYEKYWKENYPYYVVVKYSSVSRAGNAIMASLQITDIGHTIEPISQVFTLVKEENEYKISFGLGE